MDSSFHLYLFEDLAVRLFLVLLPQQLPHSKYRLIPEEEDSSLEEVREGGALLERGDRERGSGQVRATPGGGGVAPGCTRLQQQHTVKPGIFKINVKQKTKNLEKKLFFFGGKIWKTFSFFCSNLDTLSTSTYCHTGFPKL